ncbi:MAG: Gfo/Idh/MocA family oxidoreductase [Candidatus Methanomethyliales bacterium]|nr:Gfo/Idh/MocA family oxidoreductase [Candidatus Methanomethylicales archaeon]
MGEHHVRVYSGIDGCEVIGVVDVNPSRAAMVAAKYGTKALGTIEELISLSPDAVSVAVPTYLHREIAEKLLRRGISCLVEKPIASTVNDAEAIIKAAEEGGAILMVGHVERFNPAVKTLKDFLDKGNLGKALLLHAKRAGPFDPRIKDVGIIIDLMTHDIDVTRFLLGRNPNTVYAAYGRHGRDVEDYAAMILDYGGTIAVLEADRFTPFKVRTLSVTGSNGFAVLDYLAQRVEVYDQSGRRELHVDKGEPLRIEIEHFLECVKNKKVPTISGQDALFVLKIALDGLGSGVGIYGNNPYVK